MNLLIQQLNLLLYKLQGDLLELEPNLRSTDSKINGDQSVTLIVDDEPENYEQVLKSS